MLNKVQLYHCSNIKIDEFDLSRGCHFGGMLSALEAGLRKENEGILYVHTVVIEFNKMIFWTDVGHKKKWDELLIYMKISGSDIARYINKYELDYKPSYFVSSSCKVIIKEVNEITCKAAEELICKEFYFD